MAVGNTINISVPVVGTTVESFTRTSNNTFLAAAYTVGSTDLLATLSLRPATTLASNKSYGLTMRVDASIADDPGTLTKGACTVSINVQCKPGTLMTKSAIAAAVRHSLSSMLHASLIEDLHDGIAL